MGIPTGNSWKPFEEMLDWCLDMTNNLVFEGRLYM